MRRLAEGPDARSPNELAAEMGVPLSSVAYHMRVLAKKGIVGLVDERPARGAKEHFYVSLVNGDKQVGSFLRATESHDEGVEGQP
jgi:DNA-binding transcriptional ArsR family regulator